MAKAIAAIYRAIPSRPEGNGRVDATIAAHDGKGLPLASAETAAATTTTTEVGTRLTASGVSARNTPLRVVGEASRGIEFLLAYGEEKFHPAVGAFKGYVGKGHGSSSGVVGNRCAHARSVSSGTAITIPKEGGPAQFCSDYYTGINCGKQRFSPPESRNHGFWLRTPMPNTHARPNFRYPFRLVRPRKPVSSWKSGPGIRRKGETPRRKRPRAELVRQDQ